MKGASKKRGPAVSLNIVTQPSEYFRQQIARALENQRLQVGTHTEFYLVNLLNQFMLSENFKGGEILALLLAEAMTAVDRGQRDYGLRRLGDVSLYTAGFFGDSLARKVVDIDYYIGMGRTAYGNLARSGMDQSSRKVFIELADSFHRLVDVLAEISETALRLSAADILRLYEVWLKTGSERAEKRLKDAGIIPNSQVKPDIQ